MTGFESDDLDWAMGELLRLFVRANRYGVFPHELDPETFHSAWYVLNAQPFEVRQRCRSILLKTITYPLHHRNVMEVLRSRKRYAYALAH